ncbi:MAG: cell division inhibitor SulA [Candidatus Endobugula sp.]|jgi:cell division inhibitor SulA
MTIQLTALMTDSMTALIKNTAVNYAATNVSAKNIHSYNAVEQLGNKVTPLANPSLKMRAVSEVIIPSFSDSKIVVPTIIASLTQQASDRWTTWITTTVPNKALLSSLGACLSRLRIVYINPEKDTRWIIWQALAQGNSHNVIAEQTHFLPSDIERMEKAATQGKCKGMLISCA